MNALASFGRFWWDSFAADVRCAPARVAVALAVTVAFETWWILPPAVALVLAGSLYRATRHS